MSDDSYDLSDNENFSRLRFSHSFRYSTTNSFSEKQATFDSAETYLKSIVKNNLKMKELVDFYQGNDNVPGVVNTYLRLIDVYYELVITKLEHSHPNQKHFRVKIFETDILDEFEKERETGIISDALDEELQDLIDHNTLIIPIFRDDTIFIFVVQVNDD
mmetsp:Transcript_16364/g.14283  ORF Transcript_16364/g.14283 Transcript_16364/m.14283 type:complete len:160 (-) Transcript_16364:351-830(-)